MDKSSRRQHNPRRKEKERRSEEGERGEHKTTYLGRKEREGVGGRYSKCFREAASVKME